jgi:hypothetical protein
MASCFLSIKNDQKCKIQQFRPEFEHKNQGIIANIYLYWGKYISMEAML